VASPVAVKGLYLGPNQSLQRTRPGAAPSEGAGACPRRAGPLSLAFSGLLRRQACGIVVSMPQDFRDVDPRELRLPSRRGADPFKLQRQVARFGASSAGMPPPWVYEAVDGVLVLYNNGNTRATRVAKLSPGSTIRVEVVGKLRRAYAGEPKIGDLLR
jgi:hypothetical protein